MYRPEGWENPYPKVGTALPENIPWSALHSVYEAGADAYEKTLIKIGNTVGSNQQWAIHVNSFIGHQLTIPIQDGVKGYLFFLPEENE